MLLNICLWKECHFALHSPTNFRGKAGIFWTVQVHTMIYDEFKQPGAKPVNERLLGLQRCLAEPFGNIFSLLVSSRTTAVYFNECSWRIGSEKMLRKELPKDSSRHHYKPLDLLLTDLAAGACRLIRSLIIVCTLYNSVYGIPALLQKFRPSFVHNLFWWTIFTINKISTQPIEIVIKRTDFLYLWSRKSCDANIIFKCMCVMSKWKWLWKKI